ncbi:hydroxyphenylacetyl-CoA thioesterase PaaI [Homoserinimonas sp. A447]
MSDTRSDYTPPDTMLRDDRASTELLGMEVVEMAEGHAVVTMTVRDDMLNGHRIAHGGLVFTLADTAFAIACNEEGSVTVSSGAEITYLAPSLPGQTLTATAKLRSKRGRSGIYDVDVRSETGLVAEFRGHSRTMRPASNATDNG